MALGETRLREPAGRRSVGRGGRGGAAAAGLAPARGRRRRGPRRGAAGGGAGDDLVIVDSHAHATPAWYEPVEALLTRWSATASATATWCRSTAASTTRYQEQALARYPGRLVNIVQVDWTRPDAVQQLEALVARGNVSGLRLRPENLARPATTRWPSGGPPPACGWRSRSAATWTPSPRRSGRGCWQAVPEVPVVMEHLGSVNTPDGEAAPWPRRRQVMDLARFPNAHLKLHGLGEFATRASPVRVPFPFAEPVPRSWTGPTTPSAPSA